MPRPTVMTPEVIAKLEEAFTWGVSDVEACLWAGIAPASLYLYQEKHPKFSERKEALKSTPDLYAQRVVTEKIKRGDKDTAKWWLERRKKKLFGNNVDVTTDGKALPTPILGGLSKEDGDDVSGNSREVDSTN